MEQFRRLGVFLNESPGDETALTFVAEFATLANSESVVCIHVHGEGEQAAVPDPDPQKFTEQVLSRLPDAVAQRTTVEVHTGSGIPEMLRCARDGELDLMVVGRRLPSDQMGIGTAFNRLARKAPCSVLVVPNRVHLHMGRFLVPVDCSPHSKRALETALGIARAAGEKRPQVVAQIVYWVGYGYKKMGVGFHEAGRQLEARTEQRLAKFVADVDTSGVDFETICTCSEQRAAAVHDLASVLKMDMIVAGSRGVSTSAAAMLGGTVERILIGSPLPVLIVKRKGETVHLLDALLSQK